MLTDKAQKRSSCRGVAPDRVRARLSDYLWGLGWAADLPSRFDAVGVSVRECDPSEISEFLKRSFGTIYGVAADSRFLWMEQREAKRKYLDLSDLYVFQKDDRVIGIFVGNAADWSSYYIRNISLLPEFQGKGIYQQFLLYFLECLEQLEVDRVDIDVSPLNTAHLQLLNRHRFVVTGNWLSERWGALLRLTKFLNLKYELTFERQFSVSQRKEAT